MTVVCPWLARVWVSSVLVLRSAADSNSKLDITSVTASPFGRTLVKLGIRPDSSDEKTRFLAQAQLDVAAARKLLRVPSSRCSQNTFFLDWGSSGMKVHGVHSGRPDLGKKKVFAKIVGLNPKVDEPQLLAILGNLSGKLTSRHPGGGAIATAGFRLLPTAASLTWQRVRKWNMQHDLLTNCSLTDTMGCRTLPGSDEADFEMQGMIEHAHLLKLAGRRFAMASCGGASIQLGFWGSPEKDLANCVRDLHGVSSRYDKARIKLGRKRQAAWFSWLANHRVPMSIVGRSDYSAGGVDEMRERYDSWLELEQGIAATNPCVSSDVALYFSTGGKCDILAGKKRSCLLDKWGSYITRLKGRPDSTREICRESIAVFLQEDEMLSKWHTSTSCRALAAQTPEWNFMTAFSRPTQLGANLKTATTWGEVKQCIRKSGSTPMFESQEDLEHQAAGEYLTSVLLIGFLERLGLSDDASIQPSKGDVAEAVMKHLDLSPGWIMEDQDECIVESPTPHCTLHPEWQVIGMRPESFASGTTIKVACSVGFKGSNASWMVKCVHGSWKDANDHAMLHGGAAPDCTKLICNAPIDEFGIWHQGGNQNWQLECHKGFKPGDGPRSLVCTDAGSFKSFARCTPVGDAGAWRSGNIGKGIRDLFALIVLAALLLWAQQHMQKKRQAEQQESHPIMPIAEHEME